MYTITAMGHSGQFTGDTLKRVTRTTLDVAETGTRAVGADLGHDGLEERRAPASGLDGDVQNRAVAGQLSAE